MNFIQESKADIPLLYYLCWFIWSLDVCICVCVRRQPASATSGPRRVVKWVPGGASAKCSLQEKTVSAVQRDTIPVLSAFVSSFLYKSTLELSGRMLWLVSCDLAVTQTCSCFMLSVCFLPVSFRLEMTKANVKDVHEMCTRQRFGHTCRSLHA